MSEWLQSLGRTVEGTPDISKWNFAEFEEEDLVKAVNKNNDEISKTIQDQALKTAEFAEKRNKQQYKNAVALTESFRLGAPLAKMGVNWFKAEKEYSKNLDKYLNDPQTFDNDNDVQKQLEKENQRKENNNQIEILSEELPLTTKAEVLTISGFSANDIDERREIKNFETSIMPQFKTALMGFEFTIDDGKGGKIKRSMLNVENKDQFDQVQRLINTSLYSNMLDMGYDKGFLKKYVLKPLFKYSEIEAQEVMLALNKAKVASLENNRIETLAFDLTGGNYQSLIEKIGVIHQKNSVSWAMSKRTVFGYVNVMIDKGWVNSHTLGNTGDYEILDHNGDPTTIRKYYGKQGWNALEAKAVVKDNALTRARLSETAFKKDTFVNEALKGFEQNEEALKRSDIEKVIEDYETEFGKDTAPTKLTNYLNYFDSGGKTQEELMNDADNIIFGKTGAKLTWEHLMYMNAENKAKYQKYIGIQYSDKDLRMRSIDTTIALQGKLKFADPNNWGENPTDPKSQLLQISKVQDVYDNGFDEYYQLKGETAEARNNPTQFRLQAHAFAAAKAQVYLDTTYGTPDKPKEVGDKFKIVNKISSADNDLNNLNTYYQNNTITNGKLDLTQKKAFPGEQSVIPLMEDYLIKTSNGERATLPPMFRKFSSSMNISGHDLLTIRGEALGLFEKLKLKPVYSPEISKLSDESQRLLQFKNTTGRTLMVFNGDTRDVAEVLSIAAIDGRDFNSLVTNTGTVIAPDRIKELLGPEYTGSGNLETLTVQELATVLSNFPGTNAEIGIYGLQVESVKSIIKDLFETRTIDSNQLFDADFQSELYVHLLRQKVFASKINTCANPNFMGIVNVNKEEAKEFEDLLRLKNFCDVDKFPYMNLNSLIGIGARYLVEEHATQNTKQ